MSSMFSRPSAGRNSPAREKSLMSQNTHSVSPGKSAGTSRVTRSVSGRKRRFRGTGSCWKYPTRFPSALSARPSASPAPSVSPSGLTCETNTNDERRRSSATTSSVVDDTGSTAPAGTELLIDDLRLFQRLVQRDRALGGAILDERQLRRVPQVDRMPELPAQKPRRRVQRVHRLTRDMAVADDRHEHLAELHVLRDLAPHHGHKPQPRILQILADDLRQRLLNLMIDPRLSLLLHTFNPAAGPR